MFKVRNIGQFEIQNLGGRWIRPGESVVLKPSDVDPRRLASLKDAKCIFIEVIQDDPAVPSVVTKVEPAPETVVIAAEPVVIPAAEPVEEPIIIVGDAPTAEPEVAPVAAETTSTSKRRGRPKKTDSTDEG